MNVFRIENVKTKIGPYIEGIARDGYFSTNHPSPYQDGIQDLSFDYFFGFVGMRQMLNWFRFRDVFLWRKKGFRVYKYKIDNDYVRLGGHQLAFIRSRSYSRTEVKLSTLARHMCTSRLGS